MFSQPLHCIYVSNKTFKCWSSITLKYYTYFYYFIMFIIFTFISEIIIYLIKFPNKFWSISYIFLYGMSVPTWVIKIIAIEGITRVFEFWWHFFLSVSDMCAAMHIFSQGICSWEEKWVMYLNHNNNKNVCNTCSTCSVHRFCIIETVQL